MKAKAPEEIYLLPEVGNPDGLSICWYDAPYRTGAIEYIRTDAFIERAEEFIYSALNDGIMGTANIEDFMRLFKKYMKGK
jgi:hypothetical protein